MGLKEANFNFNQVGPKDQCQERTLGWWKGGNTAIKAYNEEDDITTRYQPGGCILTIVHSINRKIIGFGTNP